MHYVIFCLPEHKYMDPKLYGKALKVVRSCHDHCPTDDIRSIAELPVEGREPMQFFTFLRDYILKIKADRCIYMDHHKRELLIDFSDSGSLEVNIV